MEKERIIRATDDVGRVVLPAKWRKHLCLNEGDDVVISTHEQFIVIKKQVPSCVFCSNTAKLIKINGKTICKKCVSELQKKY